MLFVLFLVVWMLIDWGLYYFIGAGFFVERNLYYEGFFPRVYVKERFFWSFFNWPTIPSSFLILFLCPGYFLCSSSLQCVVNLLKELPSKIAKCCLVGVQTPPGVAKYPSEILLKHSLTNYFTFAHRPLHTYLALKNWLSIKTTMQ